MTSLYSGLSEQEFRSAVDMQNRLTYYWQGGKPMMKAVCSNADCGMTTDSFDRFMDRFGYFLGWTAVAIWLTIIATQTLIYVERRYHDDTNRTRRWP